MERHGALADAREAISTSTTLLGSGSKRFRRDTGRCAARSNVYSRESLGSAAPFVSSEDLLGSARLAAGSARIPVNSKLGAVPSQERRQNLALVMGKLTRFSMSVWPLARKLAIGATTRKCQSVKSSLTSTLTRPVYSEASSGQSSFRA